LPFFPESVVMALALHGGRTGRRYTPESCQQRKLSGSRGFDIAIPVVSVFCDSTPDWRWFEADSGDAVRWVFTSEAPASLIERKIRKPKLSRIFGALRCALQAKRDGSAALAAHGEYGTMWLGAALRLLHMKQPLLSFSFHYTELPTGMKLLISRWSLQQVARFAVHSEAERARYAQHLGLPVERFELVRWGVRPPPVTSAPPLFAGDYICALGKNARDYRTMIAALAKLPQVQCVVVAQPFNLEGIAIPENVKVVCNIPLAEADNILQYSQFMLLPLDTGETSCGHITIVAAMHLGKTVVATDSIGIADYFPDGYEAPKPAAGDVDGWVRAIETLTADAALRERCGAQGRVFARDYCSHEAAYQKTMEVFAHAGVKLI
jgi:glycosyltransferase involved in cell wall biosynthesis